MGSVAEHATFLLSFSCVVGFSWHGLSREKEVGKNYSKGLIVILSEKICQGVLVALRVSP